MKTFTLDRKVADLEISLRRLGGDKDLLAKLADFFLEDSPELMSQLVAAFLLGKYDVVAHRAHSLKGLSATFEAVTFQQLVSEVETLARSRDDEQLKNRIPDLEIAFDCLILLLKQIVQGAEFLTDESTVPVSPSPNTSAKRAK